MVYIKRTGYSNTNYGAMLQRFKTSEFGMSSEILEEDIEKLEKMANEKYSKTDGKNIKSIIKYLKKLRSVIHDNKIKLTWSIENNATVSSPIGLYQFKPYGIRATDYILSSSTEKVIQIDYWSMFEAVAFEVMYKDYDISFKDIESRMSDLGPIKVYDSSILLDIMNELFGSDESPMIESKFMRIGRTEFASVDGNLAFNYFGDNIEPATYDSIIQSSIKLMLSIIMKKLLENASTNSVKLKICSISEYGIYIMVDSNDIKHIEKLCEPVDIKLFGRLFEFKPQIRVY